MLELSRDDAGMSDYSIGSVLSQCDFVTEHRNGISVTWPVDFYHYIVMYISVGCTNLVRGLGYINVFLGLLVRCIFTLHKIGKVMHLRANKESAAPATMKHTYLGNWHS